jgi:hypothetical protein|tara:strand:+ start:1130 stop:1489 length:360 start_codon:yes stop_codon:yes gene_type:complete
MTIKDFIGTYNIIGKNQEDTELHYTGVLTLDVDHNNRIKAKWVINKEQEQEGIGFFKDNILVINFNYRGDNDEVYKGVVVYRCLTKDILEGFWSEDYGDPKYLGEERCFRVTNNKVILD